MSDFSKKVANLFSKPSFVEAPKQVFKPNFEEDGLEMIKENFKGPLMSQVKLEVTEKTPDVGKSTIIDEDEMDFQLVNWKHTSTISKLLGAGPDSLGLSGADEVTSNSIVFPTKSRYFSTMNFISYDKDYHETENTISVGKLVKLVGESSVYTVAAIRRVGLNSKILDIVVIRDNFGAPYSKSRIPLADVAAISILPADSDVYTTLITVTNDALVTSRATTEVPKRSVPKKVPKQSPKNIASDQGPTASQRMQNTQEVVDLREHNQQLVLRVHQLELELLAAQQTYEAAFNAGKLFAMERAFSLDEQVSKKRKTIG